MNTASLNLPNHLNTLQLRLEHATDYELALYYFLEEFAGDVKFIEQCQQEEAPHLLAVLKLVAAKALGKPTSLDHSGVFRLHEFAFNHGNAQVGDRVLLFFYFERINTGLMALIPGVRGAAEVARFRLPDSLVNPKLN